MKKNTAKLNIPITTAGSASANHTGSWRINRPVFDEELCTGCSRCAKLCPDGCIYMKMNRYSKLKAYHDYNYCKGCGICAAECPFGAITMIKE